MMIVYGIPNLQISDLHMNPIVFYLCDGCWQFSHHPLSIIIYSHNNILCLASTLSKMFDDVNSLLDEWSRTIDKCGGFGWLSRWLIKLLTLITYHWKLCFFLLDAWPIVPLLNNLMARDLPAVWLPHTPSCTSHNTYNASSSSKQHMYGIECNHSVSCSSTS